MLSFRYEGGGRAGLPLSTSGIVTDYRKVVTHWAGGSRVTIPNVGTKTKTIHQYVSITPPLASLRAGLTTLRDTQSHQQLTALFGIDKADTEKAQANAIDTKSVSKANSNYKPTL